MTFTLRFHAISHGFWWKPCADSCLAFVPCAFLCVCYDMCGWISKTYGKENLILDPSFTANFEIFGRRIWMSILNIWYIFFCWYDWNFNLSFESQILLRATRPGPIGYLSVDSYFFWDVLSFLRCTFLWSTTISLDIINDHTIIEEFICKTC